MKRIKVLLPAVALALSAAAMAADDSVESWIRPSDIGLGYELADCLNSSLQGAKPSGERVFVEVLDVPNAVDSIGEQKLPKTLRTYIERVVARVNSAFTLHDLQGMRYISPRSMDMAAPFNIGDRYGPSIQQGIAGKDKHAIQLIGQIAFADSQLQGSNSSAVLDFGGDGKTFLNEIHISVKARDVKTAEVIGPAAVTLVAIKESTSKGMFFVAQGQGLLKHQRLRYRAASLDEALRYVISVTTAQILRMAAARYLTMPLTHCQGIVDDALWLGSRYPTERDHVIQRRGIVAKATPERTRICFVFFEDARPKAESYRIRFKLFNEGDTTPMQSWDDYRTVLPTKINDPALCPTLRGAMRAYDWIEVELRDAKTEQVLDSTRERLASQIAPELVQADIERETIYEQRGMR